jgi:hypothetical protein
MSVKCQKIIIWGVENKVENYFNAKDEGGGGRESKKKAEGIPS